MEYNQSLFLARTASSAGGLCPLYHSETQANGRSIWTQISSVSETGIGDMATDTWALKASARK